MDFANKSNATLNPIGFRQRQSKLVFFFNYVESATFSSVSLDLRIHRINLINTLNQAAPLITDIMGRKS